MTKPLAKKALTGLDILDLSDLEASAASRASQDSVLSRATQASVDTLEAKLDSLDLGSPGASVPRVHLQIIKLKGKFGGGDKGDKKGKSATYLVYATEAGQPVDVTLTAVKVSDDKTPVAFTDETASSASSSAGTGKLLVTVNLPDKAKGKIIQFRIVHSHSSASHFGASTVHEHHDDNLGGAQ